jgi:excisionase family DNA binding protein
MSSNIRIKKVCQHCGEEFIAKTTVTKYCGDNCAKRAYKARKKKEKINKTPSVDEQKIEFRERSLEQKEFLNIQETSHLLGASRMTIYRQIKKGNIPAIKLGRRTIIMKSALENLFYNEGHTKTA